MLHHCKVKKNFFTFLLSSLIIIKLYNDILLATTINGCGSSSMFVQGEFTLLHKIEFLLPLLAKQLNLSLDLNTLEHFIEDKEVHDFLEKSFENSSIQKCYDSSLTKDEHLNIFNSTIGEVLFSYMKYVKTSKSFFPSLDRIKNIIHNLRMIIHSVIDCLKNPHKSHNVLGVTPALHLSKEESEAKLKGSMEETFQVKMKRYYKQFTKDERCSLTPLEGESEDLPKEFSWLSMNRVSSVADQWDCGSCYIFAAVGAIECGYMISRNTSQKIKFSEQAVMNCLGKGTSGVDKACKGGFPNDVVLFAKKNGVVLEKDEPLVVKDADTPIPPCVEHEVALKVDSQCFYFSEIDSPNFNEDSMRRLVMRNGPAAVAINSHDLATLYTKGYVHNPKCIGSINHAVLLVGWDENYWFVKNSWGTRFGHHGYYYYTRKIPDVCNITSMFVQPLINPVADTNINFSNN